MSLLPSTLFRPCRLLSRAITRLDFHPLNFSGVRSFSTTPSTSSAGGVWNNLTGKIQSSVQSRREVAADEKFTKWLSEMLAVKKFYLEDFYRMVKDSAQDAGVTGWKSMMPGVANQAGAQELKKSLTILEALTGEERKEISLIDRLVKIRAASASSVSVSDVNLVLKQYHSAGLVHAWLHSRASRGDPMPDSQEQLAQWIQRDKPSQAQKIQHKPRRR